MQSSEVVLDPNDTHAPTMHLRFKEVLYGEGAARRSCRKLQQLWLARNGAGAPQWRDVPLVMGD